LPDTLYTRRECRAPTGDTKMFKIEKTNYVVTASLFFALICAVIG
jgi:hypothetical protein